MRIETLIKKAGGAAAIVRASRAKSRTLTVDAVYKWQRRGIPDTHWDVIAELSGVPLEQIYAINKAVRRKLRKGHDADARA